jgi:hypothetical protein
MRHHQPSVGLDDVAEVRALLRRRDVAARHLGLALLRSWSAGDLDAVGARAVLEGAAGTYPALPGIHDQPAQLMAELLCGRPELVEASDVLRVFLMAGERTRRTFLHLLALRSDPDGLAALEVLFGDASPVELVPTPGPGALDPLLVHPERDRVRRLLVGLLGRPGWSAHAAGLLTTLELIEPGDADERARTVADATAQLVRLVDVCNRAALGDPRAGDPVRSERGALIAIVRLLDVLDDLDQRAALHHLLGSADPRLAAMGAARLIRRDEPVAPERLALIARDPVARADLHDGLASAHPTEPAGDVAWADDVQVHEGRMVRWLADVTELGRAPDEIEHVAVVTLPADPSPRRTHPSMSHLRAANVLFVFRFRMHAPHWSSARGWMIGVAGAHTSTAYRAEDECSLDEHVRDILAALAEWPDRRADGAA